MLICPGVTLQSLYAPDEPRWGSFNLLLKKQDKKDKRKGNSVLSWSVWSLCQVLVRGERNPIDIASSFQVSIGLSCSLNLLTSNHLNYLTFLLTGANHSQMSFIISQTIFLLKPQNAAFPKTYEVVFERQTFR